MLCGLPFSSCHVVQTEKSFSGAAFEAVSQLWMMRVRDVRGGDTS